MAGTGFNRDFNFSEHDYYDHEHSRNCHCDNLADSSITEQRQWSAELTDSGWHNPGAILLDDPYWQDNHGLEEL